MPALPVSGTIAQRAALASVGVASVLLVLKVMAVSRTGSAAMLGSLADTGLDLIASLVTLLGVRVAATPADHNHRFGHGKAEALASLFQVALIAVAAVAIGWRSLNHFSGAHQVASADYGIGVSVVAMVLSIGLIAYQRRAIAQTGSLAIGTDSLHYQSDLVLNLSVIAALALEQYAGISGADPVFGVGIALWLAWGAWRSANAAIDQLMDHEWPVAERQHFLKIVAQHPELKGIHDVRTRSSGAQRFVQFHVWVDPEMTVAEAHRVMDEVEARLEKEFPGVEILIHPDPEGHVDPDVKSVAISH
ncbi:divalent metal cation transporter FieF [Sphingobium sp. SCG-1]|uniref:cation diffusion facilitator family transporter n=1 Tax=Sphingobium sp. SCG-1 TaxID=2072936 RepID=UPI000CD6AB5B|nr:cation diffusion facilitator family transporter [Sphingobium sp. SCG-1]AUW57761.1 divalent metal cation transporter FieF [Sphingobium sp. SCG-1]